MDHEHKHIITVQKNSENSKHIECTIFMHGANVGTLKFQVNEYHLFIDMLEDGASSHNSRMPAALWPADGVEVLRVDK